MVALCATENDHYILRQSFFSVVSAPIFSNRRTIGEINLHDVSSSAIENVPFTFS